MKDCFICGEKEDDLIFKFTIKKQKFYLCLMCETLFGNNTPKEFSSILNDTNRLRLYKSSKTLLKTIALDAPKPITAHQIAVVLLAAITDGQWDSIKDTIFKNNSHGDSYFSEQQLVEIVTAAELSKPRRY